MQSKHNFLSAYSLDLDLTQTDFQSHCLANPAMSRSSLLAQEAALSYLPQSLHSALLCVLT